MHRLKTTCEYVYPIKSHSGTTGVLTYGEMRRDEAGGGMSFGASCKRIEVAVDIQIMRNNWIRPAHHKVV